MLPIDFLVSSGDLKSTCDFKGGMKDSYNLKKNDKGRYECNVTASENEMLKSLDLDASAFNTEGTKGTKSPFETPSVTRPKLDKKNPMGKPAPSELTNDQLLCYGRAFENSNGDPDKGLNAMADAALADPTESNFKLLRDHYKKHNATTDKDEYYRLSNLTNPKSPWHPDDCKTTTETFISRKQSSRLMQFISKNKILIIILLLFLFCGK